MKKIPASLAHRLMDELRIYNDTDTKVKVLLDYCGAFKKVFPELWDEDNLDLVFEKLMTDFNAVHQRAIKRNDVSFEGFKTIFIQRKDISFLINLN